MCVISKPISHEELEHVALVVSSLIGVIVADEELNNVGSNWNGTSTIKWKRVDAEEIFWKIRTNMFAQSLQNEGVTISKVAQDFVSPQP